MIPERQADDNSYSLPNKSSLHLSFGLKMLEGHSWRETATSRGVQKMFPVLKDGQKRQFLWTIVSSVPVEIQAETSEIGQCLWPEMSTQHIATRNVVYQGLRVHRHVTLNLNERLDKADEN